MNLDLCTSEIFTGESLFFFLSFFFSFNWFFLKRLPLLHTFLWYYLEIILYVCYTKCLYVYSQTKKKNVAVIGQFLIHSLEL